MLSLPESGLRRSTEHHNSDLQLFCDWMEGNILFKEETFSRTDVVDILTEGNIYADEDFANQWLDAVWAELTRRQALLQASAPLSVKPRSITRRRKWQTVPAYAFCVLGPLLQTSKTWFPKSYSALDLAKHSVQQGELFEQISRESLASDGWTAHSAGWSQRQAAKLPHVVRLVADHVGEPEHFNWRINVSPDANDAGLDVVLSRRFADGRCGFPTILVQCAAGNDWDTKLHTPILNVWNKLVDFAIPPQKAFAIPHSLDAIELRRIAVKVGGMVFDRYRLHAETPLRKHGWCTPKLKTDLNKFLTPLVAHLPNHA